MTTTEIERRLTAVEEDLASLRAQIASSPPNPNSWVEDIAGTFANDSLFGEAVRLGRKWRKSDPLKPASTKRRGRSKTARKRA